jgi:hypothetical protein
LASEISGELRRSVAERARYRCEYCLLRQDDSYSPHQIDHIIGQKHGGLSIPDNLAYACLRCNAWKGSDIGSIDPETGRLVSLFNPRLQLWSAHFSLRGFVIAPLTAEGRATAQLLRLNIDKRITERQALMLIDRYPPE